MRPFTFLVDDYTATTAAELGERARRAEAIGATTFVIPDHLVPQLAPIPYLATVAAATERLRVGAFVLNNDLRHPAVLAQDLATLDVLSGGRLDVAIGAGWNKPEYDAIGLPFDPVGVRGSPARRGGRGHQGLLRGRGRSASPASTTRSPTTTAYPKPIQQPHPPFFIGGGGRRTLTLAAREADIVGLAPRILTGSGADPRSITWAATEEKIGWVREAAGDRFDDLEFNVYPSQWPITVTDDLRGEARKVIDRMKERTGIELTEDEVLDSPHIFIGSIDAARREVPGAARAARDQLVHGRRARRARPVVERLARLLRGFCDDRASRRQLGEIRHLRANLSGGRISGRLGTAPFPRGGPRQNAASLAHAHPTATGLWSPGRRALTIGLVLTVTLVASEALAVSTIMPIVDDDLGRHRALRLGLLGVLPRQPHRHRRRRRC